MTGAQLPIRGLSQVPGLLHSLHFTAAASVVGARQPHYIVVPGVKSDCIVGACITVTLILHRLIKKKQYAKNPLADNSFVVS